MNLQVIREFLILAELRHFSKAAQALRISQPSLSRHIRALEEELGCTLLTRNTPVMELTEEGKILHDGGLLLAEQADRLLQEIRDKVTEMFTLHVGLIAGAMNEDIVVAIQATCREFPDLKSHIYELPPTHQLDRLSARKLDVAVIGGPVEGSEKHFDLFLVGHLTLQLLVAETSPLRALRRISVAQLEDVPVIGMDPQYFPASKRYIERIFRSVNLKPNYVAFADGGSALASLVATHDAIGIAPDITARVPHPGVVYRTLDSPEAYGECLAAVAKGEKRQTVRRFLMHLKNYHELTFKARAAKFEELMDREFGKISASEG